jgi:hypothetical protein
MATKGLFVFCESPQFFDRMAKLKSCLPGIRSDASRGIAVRKNSLVETFSALYGAASPEEQAALRVWMRDIVLPRKEGRNNLARSRRSEKDSVAARDRRILEFPLSTSSKTVAKVLKTEGWYSPKTTIYHIEFRVNSSRHCSTKLPGATTRMRRESALIMSSRM